MNLPYPPRHRLYQAIWGLVCVLVATLLISVAALLWNQRATALAESRSQLAQLTSGAEVGLNRALLAIDVLLATFEELLAGHGESDAALRERASGPAVSAVARQNLMLRNVVLLDGQGRPVTAFGGGATVAQADLPPPVLVRKALSQALPTLVIGQPMMNLRSVERVIPVARQLRLNGGGRALIAAQIPLDTLVPLLMQGMALDEVELTLEGADGALLIGLAAPQGLDERERVAGALPVASAAAPGEADAAHTRLRDLPGLVSARRLMYADLWTTASLSRDAALADWRRQAWLIGGGTLLLVATMVLAGSLAAVYGRRMHRARTDVARSKALLDQALGAMVSGFLLLDGQRRLVQWNQRFEEFFPWLSPLMRTGATFRHVLESTVHYHLPGADAEAKREWVEDRLRQQRDPRSTLEQRLPSGRVVQITERPTPDGGVVILYHDVTELRQATADVEQLAFYDPLTGLPNRRLLLQGIEQTCADAARSGVHAALLFIDLDHFKTLNDTMGHEMGDLLLGQVAKRLHGGVRVGDIVARLGGDEFVVVLPQLDRDTATAEQQARAVADQVLALLARPYALDGHMHHNSASIGVTLFGRQLQTATDVLKQADIAMYEAKVQRGNTVRLFDPSMQAAVSARARLVADLKEALPQDQLRLYLQPQFNAEGQVVGAEALLRWQHPGRGLVAPGQFIAVAEESELIVPIGRWVLATACEMLGRWQEQPHLRDVCLSVNVSARQFRQPDFAAQVAQCLDDAGARPHLLELELTESLVLENVVESIAKMHQLRTRGVRFAVDDFGTGYSSLAYLTRLPLHRLKIDRSFVLHLGERSSDDVVVQTILGMARNLELDVIAEGVETQQQRDFLAAHGCSTYQGYLFARPMPVEQFEEWMRARPAAAAP